MLDIAEVAARTGLAPSALRYYEKEGLVEPTGRNGLRRTYRPEVLERLGLITCARAAGFTVREISRFLAARPEDNERMRAGMAAKVHDLDEKIDQLVRMRESLRHAATCTHEPLVECPDFRRAVRNVYAPETAA
ncbi:MerR family transcriptional regulator [Spirillospora sp. NPDC047279]|uniref:MerR family transcriptional regulator n=1 Tax=Spirillospora sp. NPDC047279 TaxID=3155478 RepID=UPI0033D1F92A